MNGVVVFVILMVVICYLAVRFVAYWAASHTDKKHPDQ
jgi:hypothetical protein